MPLEGRRAGPAEPPDWRAMRGPAVNVDGPPPGELIAELTIGDFRYWAARQADGARWVIRHKGAAETELDLGLRTIKVRAHRSATVDYSHLLLAGSGLAHALAADGHLAMHASAVERDGRAIAFIGPSGRGKSTLAGLLCADGALAVSDDVLRCEAEAGRAYCYRGSARLRLRPKAASLAERIATPEETADGRTAVLAGATSLERVPLAALVVPMPSRKATRLEVERLRGRAAAIELLRSPRLAGWIDPELVTMQLDICHRLAASVPVLAATIPWGPPFADGLGSELIDRVLSAA